MTPRLEHAITAMREALRELGFFPKKPAKVDHAQRLRFETARAAGLLDAYRTKMGAAPPKQPAPLTRPENPAR